MDKVELTNFYDALKSDLASSAVPKTPMMNVGSSRDPQHYGAELFRRKAIDCRNELEDQCAKHIIVDIYCKILPLDQSYIDGNHGRMVQDVTSMLDNKGMTATQYLKSCSEKTKAPLVEFVQRSISNIGRAFMEAEEEKLQDAQAAAEPLPAPETPNAETNDDVQDALVDVKEDPEYNSFVDALKKKTVDKIVQDVTDIINNKKEENDMTFDPKPEATIADNEAATESTLSVGLNYLQQKLMKESVDITDEMHENMIGLAIRESTLNEINRVFNQPESDFKSFYSKIRFNKGVLINESAVSYFFEQAFTEMSHGNLKQDHRLAVDAKTGHNLHIVYSLDGIKLTQNNTVGGKFSRRIENGGSIGDDEVALMKKLGNTDHESYNQKVLAIIDMETGEKLKEVTCRGPFGINDRTGINKSKDGRLYKLKVGEIDKDPSYKSTVWRSGDNINNSAGAIEQREGIRMRGVAARDGEDGNLPKKHIIGRNKVIIDDFNKTIQECIKEMNDLKKEKIEINKLPKSPERTKRVKDYRKKLKIIEERIRYNEGKRDERIGTNEFYRQYKGTMKELMDMMDEDDWDD